MCGSAVWEFIGASVRGASHVRQGLPNQDAIGRRTLPDAALVALADGHGSPRYVRSHQGAKLAVRVALDELQRFHAGASGPELLKRQAEEQLPRSLVRSWQDAVQRQLARHPLTGAETEQLRRHSASKRRPAAALAPHRAFGATLLAAILSARFALYLQLGDGDIVAVDQAGAPARVPLTTDDRLMANQTTSLAGEQAWHDFRIYFQPFVHAMPAMVFFATDGYANSFQDDDGFLAAAADLYQLCTERGLAHVRRRLPGWLAETSARGSGDDISVGIALRCAA